MSWFQKIFSKEKARESYLAACWEVRLSYGEKSIVYNPSEQTITYRNVISPRDGGDDYPDNYFFEKTVRLLGNDAARCNEAVERSLAQLPLWNSNEGIQGAEPDSYLAYKTRNGRERYYSNMYFKDGSFTLTCEPVHSAFLSLFKVLNSFCSWR